ncbi:hypothetical protein GCM10028806_56680 [Spirosoma terrae]|uniref:TraM recognition domain-containing protein n=1 Tax=Spirosoma terrae TaxID=1968276 RepID=A0A6L9LJU2_9BACT|nr:TraM recognition domain-containing protein [Spirosoma terrae]NDU99243.1 TraM recognition domain-containing protein [Spirosoma terrae]
MEAILNKTLFHFDQAGTESFKVVDAVRGVQIFGGIGSGKTSGSGKWIAKSFLMNGFGGIVLCGKPDEAETWIEYAKQSGRQKDIIHFREGSEYYFNPLEYERSRTDEGGGLTSNLSTLFLNLYKLGQRINGGEPKEGERFWEASLKRCLNRVIDLIKMSGQELSVRNMVEIVASMPDADEMVVISGLDEEGVKKHGEDNYCLRCLHAAYEQLDEEDTKLIRDYYLVDSYFMEEMPKLYPETRTTIQEMFRGLAEPFLSGLLADHFAQGLNISPEATHEGKIIILDFPVKKYLEAGIYAQGIFKLIWQQATERRRVNTRSTPVFLWVDESQYFINEYDMMFQTTARSSLACTVFLTQNISNYYAVLGGNDPKAKVDSLLGNLSTKIFHANNDYVTNEWAAKTIGQSYKNISSMNNIGGQQTSAGLSQQFNWQVEPRIFTQLKSGGRDNNYIVEAVVTITGKDWGVEKRNFALRAFSQKI